MSDIISVQISELNLNDTYFHFTSRKNIEKIQSEGLKARAGDASKMVGDNEPRVYLSKGGKGLLKTKDTFIYKFKNIRICDIPLEYREYFDIDDFSSTLQISEKDVYSAMEKKFKDEVYLKVDAVKEEDYLEEEINSLWGMEHDIKGKENHNIDVEKISLIIGENGDSALDTIEYIYKQLIERNPGKEEVIKNMFPEVSGMFEYIRQRDNSKRVSMKSAISNAINSGVTLEDVKTAKYMEYVIEEQKNKEEGETIDGN